MLSLLPLLTLLAGLAFADEPPPQPAEVAPAAEIAADRTREEEFRAFLASMPKTITQGRISLHPLFYVRMGPGSGPNANPFSATTADQRVWSRKRWTSGGPIPLMDLRTNTPMHVPHRDRTQRILDDQLPLEHAPRNVAELVSITGGTSLLSDAPTVVFLDGTALISQPLWQARLPSQPLVRGASGLSGGWNHLPR